MEVVVILVALALCFFVLKFISGMIKFAVLAAIVVGALFVAGVFG